MRTVGFFVLFGTSLTLVYVHSKPTRGYDTFSLANDTIRVKKRHDDFSTGYLEQCGVVAFPKSQRGVVNVLAFLDSSWPYSHRQAIMLKMLNERLRRSGLPDALFFVVNVDPSSARTVDNAEDQVEREAWLGVSPDEIESFSDIVKTADSLATSMTPGIQLIQDNERLKIWKELRGSRDQVLVIDRCGKLAYQVIVPWSILHFPYVKAAILSTYKDEPCGPCDFIDKTQDSFVDPDETTTTMTTAPEEATQESDVTLATTSEEYFQTKGDDDPPVTTESPSKGVLESTESSQSEPTSAYIMSKVTDVSKDQSDTTTVSTNSKDREEFTTRLTDLRNSDTSESTYPASNYDTTNISTKEESTSDASTNIYAKEESTSDASTNIYVKEESTSDASTNIYVKEESTSYASTNIYVKEESTSDASTNIYAKEESTSDASTNISAKEESTSDESTNIYVKEETTSYASTNIYTKEKSTSFTISDATESTSPANFNATDSTYLIYNYDTTTDLNTRNHGEDIIEKEDLKSVAQNELIIPDKSSILNDGAVTESSVEKEAFTTSSSLSDIPIRIIMHAPHFHVDGDSTRMHEYLVLKTGSSDYHRHLASYDATRSYGGPQDFREKPEYLRNREIEAKKWSMTSVIYNRDESPGLYGEVADYWKNSGGQDNDDYNDETEPSTVEQSTSEPNQDEVTSKAPLKTNDQSLLENGIVKQESTLADYGLRDSVAITEKLQADFDDENTSEKQALSDETLDVEEEETRSKLIAHYSKLLPWIYYVLD